MFNDPTPKPPEVGHQRVCLAAAIIAAVENFRDQEGMSDHEFRLEAQGNVFLAEADEYLSNSLMTCRCTDRPKEETLALARALLADEAEEPTDTSVWMRALEIDKILKEA